MTTRNKLLLHGAAIAVFGLPCLAKTPTLTGKVLAYDPLLHAAKNASLTTNREELILETSGMKMKYVKVVFVGSGATQIDEKYFAGTEPASLRALRDRTCDESYPRMVTQVGLDQRSGTYLLTDAFKTSPPPRIKTLECYDAIQKK